MRAGRDGDGPVLGTPSPREQTREHRDAPLLAISRGTTRSSFRPAMHRADSARVRRRGPDEDVRLRERLVVELDDRRHRRSRRRLRGDCASRRTAPIRTRGGRGGGAAESYWSCSIFDLLAMCRRRMRRKSSSAACVPSAPEAHRRCHPRSRPARTLIQRRQGGTATRHRCRTLVTRGTLHIATVPADVASRSHTTDLMFGGIDHGSQSSRPPRPHGGGRFLLRGRVRRDRIRAVPRSRTAHRPAPRRRTTPPSRSSSR